MLASFCLSASAPWGATGRVSQAQQLGCGLCTGVGSAKRRDTALSPYPYPPPPKLTGLDFVHFLCYFVGTDGWE